MPIQEAKVNKPTKTARRIREGDIVETPWQQIRFVVWSVRGDTLVVYAIHDPERFLRLINKTDVRLVEQ
jgi:hypothetical protein